MDIGAIWDLIVLNPVINVLIVCTKYLFNNFGLTIIVFTVVIRAAMYPLSKKQLSSSKRMQEIQPKMAVLQKKYAKDRQKLAKEQMALEKFAQGLYDRQAALEYSQDPHAKEIAERMDKKEAQMAMAGMKK